MSDIFKPRKIPKHLIIRESYVRKPKPRFAFWRVVGWALLLGLLTWCFILLQAHAAL